ncbi:ExbD/TolR family protein [Roseibium marinum]|uniref:Biopolymer transport protein ExbD n=1 Tax=Roseibium marinum TaxID=281252 RepID=A0A2S3UNM2_9HYPH|nr:biopolymer transporter ExbD [Roseibium marinum]POF29274.1 biopolymer transport protein ExbD [Roseibium marinum]
MISIRTPLGKRRRIPLTPLIDVIFILVMFFLLSSSFGIWRPLEVSLGGERAGESVSQPPEAAPSILILARPHQESGVLRLTVNGLELELDELADELDRLAGLGAVGAILIPAGGTGFQEVVRILDEARSSRIKRVSLKLD